MNELILETIQKLTEAQGQQTICRKQLGSAPMPSIDRLTEIVQICRSVLFPGYFGGPILNNSAVNFHIGVSVEQLQRLLVEEVKAGLSYDCAKNTAIDVVSIRKAEEITTQFIQQLPDILNILFTDVIAAFNGDPAAKSYGEIIFCYPSIRAISNYRIAHTLLQLGVPLIPRIITEMAHSETGIDIHPGAKIGNYFTIDHGTGVVIGETAVIGNHVKMYQGVTLGAKSFELDEHGNPIKGIDRHPHIGNNVIIYANSTILGTIHIGDGAIIGGNLWIDTDVPPKAILSQYKKNN